MMPTMIMGIVATCAPTVPAPATLVTLSSETITVLPTWIKWQGVIQLFAGFTETSNPPLDDLAQLLSVALSTL